MGKASSSKKVARAARASGRPGTKRSYGWPLAIAGVVALGVLLVVLSFDGDDSETGAPEIGEHWHAAYGVYDCDAYIAPFADERGDRTGIHTHQDGLMHMHPFISRVAGKNANLAAFAEDVGMDLSDTSIEAPGIERENGDECGSEPGRLRLLTWDGPGDDSPSVRTKDLDRYAPPDGSVWVLAFAPADAEVPKPPSTINLDDPTAAEEGRLPASQTTTTAPGDTTTTTAAGGEPAPTTTAPAAGSSTTAP